MTYILNKTVILQPTTGRWMPRRPDDISGEGRPIYPAIYQFQLRWQLMPINDYYDVRNEWEKSITGTVVVELPDPEASSYVFREFSGCYLQQPLVGAYFQEHVTDVVLMVTNINV